MYKVAYKYEEQSGQMKDTLRKIEVGYIEERWAQNPRLLQAFRQQ